MPAVEPILKDLTAIKVAADRQVKVRSAECGVRSRASGVGQWVGQEGCWIDSALGRTIERGDVGQMQGRTRAADRR